VSSVPCVGPLHVVFSVISFPLNSSFMTDDADLALKGFGRVVCMLSCVPMHVGGCSDSCGLFVGEVEKGKKCAKKKLKP